MIKKILAVIGSLILIAGILLAGIIYKIDFKKELIKSSVSDDKIHTLTVCEIGEPEFPFGSANCRFVLKENRKTVSKLDFEICNDGGWALPENVEIQWQEDCAFVIVNGEEQCDTVYHLYFDGKTDKKVLAEQN